MAPLGGVLINEGVLMRGSSRRTPSRGPREDPSRTELLVSASALPRCSEVCAEVSQGVPRSTPPQILPLRPTAATAAL